MNPSLLVGIAILLCAVLSPSRGADVPSVRPEYFESPESRPAEVCQEMAAAAGVRAITYEGPIYRGKPSRVFAFYGAPANASANNRVPGIVLVHGGGGTAFETWVKQWVDRGYAAIAMDTCGSVPIGTAPQKGRFSNVWQRLPDGGPAGWGGIGSITGSPEDNWMHQATAAVILGHSWLRAQPEVDAERTGITGISWGGVLTCRAVGQDSRFKFAVPVYGCGFLDENSTWQPALKSMGADGQSWADLYDPGRVLPDARTPILWLNGTNDFAFPPDSWRKSARTAPGTARICMPLRMPHGHGGAGENREEILAFANSIVRAGEPLTELGKPVINGPSVTLSWKSVAPAKKVELIFTRMDSGLWKDRLWESLPAHLNEHGLSATASLPDDARYWYLHVTDHRGLAVSTEYVERTLPEVGASAQDAR